MANVPGSTAARLAIATATPTAAATPAETSHSSRAATSASSGASVLNSDPESKKIESAEWQTKSFLNVYEVNPW